MLKETLKRSHAVPTECEDKYAIVVYDLAVAKIRDKFRFKILKNLMTVSYSSVNSTQFYHYFHQKVKYWKELVLPIFFPKQRSLPVVPFTNF